MSRLNNPDEPYFLADGTVAALGTMYFGQPNTDPTTQDGFGVYTNAKAPYTDRALATTTTAQITLTAGGKLPNRLFLSGAYSITLKDADGVQVFAIASYQGESTDTIGDDSDYAGASVTATLNAIKTALDALTSAAIIDIVYPVGSIYANYTSTNPATLLGTGTWTQVGQGRCLAGIGQGTDQNAVNKTLTVGDNDGSYEHVLTEAQLASHAHGHRDRYFAETVYAPAPYKEAFPTPGYNAGVGSPGIDLTNTHFYYYDDTSESTGSGDAHENMVPTYAVYLWRRTA